MAVSSNKPLFNVSKHLDKLKSANPGLFRLVGNPRVLATSPDIGKVNLLACYDVPLDFCHSYDPEDLKSAPEIAVAQGGLLNSLFDNAMTMAVQVVSGGRFQTTLDMSCQLLRPTRPGLCWAKATVSICSGSIAFASVHLYADEGCTKPTCFAKSTSKLIRTSKL